MNAPTAIQAVEQDDSPRALALLRAIGFDKLSTEQRELALNIAARYDLDPLLKHLVMIDGRAYITRDGLLHVAHRSGQLDGIEAQKPAVVDKFWEATVTVYRKDMSRGFTYTGRYPVDGRNKQYAPEMAVKVGEVMSLRRAFDVAAPAAEERWDVEVPAEPPKPAPSLAEVVAEKAAEVAPAAEPGQVKEVCGAEFPYPYARCDGKPGHAGKHRGTTMTPVGPGIKDWADGDLPQKAEAPAEKGMTYADFRAAFARTDPKPTKGAVTAMAVSLFPDVKDDIELTDARDWPLTPQGWAQLAEALEFAP